MDVSFCYGRHFPVGSVLHNPNTSTSFFVPIYTCPWKMVGTENDVAGPIVVCVTPLLLL
jgi:hypothetical protein